MNAFATVKDLQKKIQTKEISAHEVFSYFNQRAQRLNHHYNAYTEFFDNQEEFGVDYSAPLAGIPGIIKGNIAVKGKVCHAGSRMLKNYKAPYHSTMAERVFEFGGTCIGSSNCDEFAMGSTGEYSAFGPAKNPWDTTRTPGGSSSGISSAIAAGLACWGIGTETGGSVRQPAAFCNLVGLYPTYGLFSRFGLIAFGSSLDQAGPITRTVWDNALLASAMSGHDSRDSTSLPEPKKDYTRKLDGHMPEGLTIGVIKEAFDGKGLDPEIHAAFKRALVDLEHLGCKIKVIEHHTLKYGIGLYFILSRAEAASNLSRFDGTVYGNRAEVFEGLQDMFIKTRSQNFGLEVKRRIMMGNFVLSSAHRDFYEKADHIRKMIRAECDEAFTHVDLLVTPTTTTLPFKLGQAFEDPLAIYYSDYYSVPFNIAGLPSIALPGGFSRDGLPIGIQFVGPRLSEELQYRAAYAFEQHTGYYTQTPSLIE